jgi:hypothetical protein
VTSSVEWGQARRIPDGPWLCCAVGCDRPAAVQVAVAAPTEDDPDATAPVMACDDHAPSLP